MKTEIEILFWDINKDALRLSLLKVGAILTKPEFLQKRIVYDFGMQKNESVEYWSFLRLRDEQDKVTLTYKKNLKNKYAEETEIIVNNFEDTKKLLENLGYMTNSYQENIREIWKLKNTQITLDTWPFLNPVCEVESETEDELYQIIKDLNLDLQKSQKENINTVYKNTYGKYIEDLSLDQQKRITFNDENPFL